ncbi:uncharacterized protein G2W53_013567 [Senna tora]|uniref:Uncharacterized protein n=1 Tax=Senna tora TaxID=362788 RepID=A0A834TZY5_9FABA|nr:uncharacterized protein G2W53_013567 [Senna tora]
MDKGIVAIRILKASLLSHLFNSACQLD